MGTAKSDDESDVSSHPLAENRPGVYVQVVAPRRRKRNKRGDSASTSRPAGGDARASTRAPDSEARASAREPDDNVAFGSTREAGSQARGGVREETDPRVRARRQSDPRGADSDESPPGFSSGPPSSTLDAQREDLSSRPSEAPTVVGRFAIPDLGDGPVANSDLMESRRADEMDADDGRQSGERPVDLDSARAREAASEVGSRKDARASANSPDLLGLSLPPPPRLPSFGHVEEPVERASAMPGPVSASLLDAPPTLRPEAPDSTPAARPSATLLAFVAAFTAIIVTAGLVALRELTRSAESGASRAAVAEPVDPSPAAVPAPPQQGSAAPSIAARAAPTPTSQAAPPPRTLAAPADVESRALPHRTDARSAAAKKAAPARALVAKANAALRELSNTGIKATPQSEPDQETEEAERAPSPGEPLELPVNPY